MILQYTIKMSLILIPAIHSNLSQAMNEKCEGSVTPACSLFAQSDVNDSPISLVCESPPSGILGVGKRRLECSMNRLEPRTLCSTLQTILTTRPDNYLFDYLYSQKKEAQFRYHSRELVLELLTQLLRHQFNLDSEYFGIPNRLYQSLLIPNDYLGGENLNDRDQNEFRDCVHSFFKRLIKQVYPMEFNNVDRPSKFDLSVLMLYSRFRVQEALLKLNSDVPLCSALRAMISMIGKPVIDPSAQGCNCRPNLKKRVVLDGRVVFYERVVCGVKRKVTFSFSCFVAGIVHLLKVHMENDAYKTLGEAITLGHARLQMMIPYRIQCGSFNLKTKDIMDLIREFKEWYLEKGVRVIDETAIFNFSREFSLAIKKAVSSLEVTQIHTKNQEIQDGDCPAF